MTVHTMRRPRIKPEHRAYRTVDGHIRIGSVVYGIGSEVKDPDGWLWTLVEAMDGTLRAADVVAEVSRRHPAVPGRDIEQAMTDLTEAGYVEDAGAAPPAELSERERERYSRGMTLLRWMDLRPRESLWEPQLRLRRARVLLIGVGGTGGAAARDLAASGVGRLHCVEPDVVELSNLNRQTLFREHDLGTPKIDAALTALRALNSDTTVTGERREVRGPADLEDLLTGGSAGSGDGSSAYDALLLAADRPAVIRRWANQVCLASGTPELAHLVTARAVGVPGKMRLGTRLQFLVMQTDISGIELAPRRHRLTAYLAGIALNLSLASSLILVLALADPGTTAHRLLAAALLLTLMPLPFQLMVFTRTDLYFVLQDHTGCRNLYGDGLAYARYAFRRALRSAADDPSTHLPPHERRAVRLYSVVLVVGTAACLTFMAVVTLPVDIALLVRAARGLGPEHSLAGNADAVAVLVILGGVNVLWLVTWWRNRRARPSTAGT